MVEGAYPVPPDEASEVQRRLCEARAWCLAKFNPDDPRFSLRSPDLKPPREFTNEFRGGTGQIEYDALSTEQRAALVNEVSRRRSIMLAQHSIACPDWAAAGDGELLVVAIDYSLWEGLPESESNGFFDSYDIPAWDTWVHLQRFEGTDVLLSWVPRALIETVNNGIIVSTTACIEWIDGLRLSAAERKSARWF